MIDSELVERRIAQAIALIYTPLGCRRRWRLGRLLIDLIRRMEGGYMRSATARRLLAKCHGVEIGAYSYGPCFEAGTFPPMVKIGRYTSIAMGVRIVNENHPIESLSTHPAFYSEGGNRRVTEIGSDVWIGFNAIILPGCRRIGHGAIIGAGSVVTKDVPEFAIVAGVPARVIRYRFDEPTRSRLLASRWWDKSLEELRTSLTEISSQVFYGKSDSDEVISQ